MQHERAIVLNWTKQSSKSVDISDRSIYGNYRALLARQRNQLQHQVDPFYQMSESSNLLSRLKMIGMTRRRTCLPAISLKYDTLYNIIIGSSVDLYDKHWDSISQCMCIILKDKILTQLRPKVGI